MTPPPPPLSSQIPLCRVIRFNIDYTIHFIEEMTPEVGINPSTLPSLTPLLFFSSPVAEANLQLSACVSAPANPRRRGEAEVDYTDKVAYVIK